MKHPRTLLTSTALVLAAAFAGGSLTSAVLGPDEASAEQAEAAAQRALAAAGVSEAGAAELPASSAVDTCTLLTEAEAAAALGSDVTVVPNPAQCTYVALDSTARGLAVAVPEIAANRRDLKAGVEQTASALAGTQREITAGDEAYAVLSATVSQAIGTVDGKFVVVVLTNPQGTPDQQATQLNGLLEKALSRL